MLASAGGGNEEHGFADMRYGGTKGPKISIIASTSWASTAARKTTPMANIRWLARTPGRLPHRLGKTDRDPSGCRAISMTNPPERASVRPATRRHSLRSWMGRVPFRGKLDGTLETSAGRRRRHPAASLLRPDQSSRAEFRRPSGHFRRRFSAAPPPTEAAAT